MLAVPCAHISSHMCTVLALQWHTEGPTPNVQTKHTLLGCVGVRRTPVVGPRERCWLHGPLGWQCSLIPHNTQHMYRCAQPWQHTAQHRGAQIALAGLCWCAHHQRRGGHTAAPRKHNRHARALTDATQSLACNAEYGLWFGPATLTHEGSRAPCPAYVLLVRRIPTRAPGAITMNGACHRCVHGTRVSMLAWDFALQTRRPWLHYCTCMG